MEYDKSELDSDSPRLWGHRRMGMVPPPRLLNASPGVIYRKTTSIPHRSGFSLLGPPGRLSPVGRRSYSVTDNTTETTEDKR